MMMLRLGLSSLLLGVFDLSGCNDKPVSCDDDVLGCDESAEFELASDCSEQELTGELELVVGQGDGEGGFRALEPNALPELHYGSQGGMHLWTGVQIRNPNLARPLHRIELALSWCSPGNDCSLAESWSSETIDDDNLRTMVVDDESLVETAAGGLELRDVLLILPWEYDDRGQQRLSVRVQDSCDRWGEAVHLDPGE